MITAFDIYPNYYGGHTFTWDVPANFPVAPPWLFQVEHRVGTGGWESVSPWLDTLFSYRAGRQARRNANDMDEYYRVVMTWGSSGRCESVPVGPYGVMSRWDWLQAREVIRRFMLLARKKAGVPTLLWRKITTGAKCAVCVDASTGVSLDPDCPACMGTRFMGGYHGPYPSWSSFSAHQSDKTYDPADGGVSGATDIASHAVKSLCQPPARKNDVLVDSNSGRRYIVHTVNSAFELRRIPIIQSIVVSEAPLDCILQRLDNGGTVADDADYGPGGRLSVFLEKPETSVAAIRDLHGSDQATICESVEYI